MRSLLLIVLLSGCLGDPDAPTHSDAGFVAVPDGAMACQTDNDGVLTRGELPLQLGISARYLQNPEGTEAMVDPVGQDSPEGTAWDFSSTAGVAVDLPIEKLDGAWYQSYFPSGTYATYTDVASRTLGVFRLTDAALELMGYASETPNQTILVYDQPVALVRFPLQLGDGWVTTGHIVNGTFNHLPVAETDTYQISVDKKGVVVLPYLRVGNTLRVRVTLDQALPGGTTTHTIQLIYFRECVGEVGRMVSRAGETNADFTSAAIFRRLAL
jgi:hypothetical protein